MAQTLIRAGALKSGDFIGKRLYQIAKAASKETDIPRIVPTNVRDQGVDDYEVLARTLNCRHLHRLPIVTIGQLAALSDAELLRVPYPRSTRLSSCYGH